MRWPTLDGEAPRIIAHRGASGRFPEHVMPGYQAALDEGADIIEPDLLMSRDGVLVCRHDLGLARSTDIASRPEFAGRKVDGDWWCWDVDAAEIGRLGAIQPFSARDQSLNGTYHPPRFSELLHWAAKQSAVVGHDIVLYPEIKHPRVLAARGLDPVPAFVDAVRRRPPGVALLLQCFDGEVLRALTEATGLPGMLLVDSRGHPLRELARHRDWLSGLALSKHLLLGPQGPRFADAIHAAGLRIDAWTIRDDQPADGHIDSASEIRQLIGIGVDRLFCDFPASARAVRDTLGR